MKQLLFFLPLISALSFAQPPPPPPPGGFSLNIDNQFLPFAVGMVNVLQDPVIEVTVSVLDQTEVVDGVTTRVVEEYELENGQLVEISRNWFAQHADGTVYYFGEWVDVYQNGQIVGHGGSWRAGDGPNLAGIMMPASPYVGQTYTMEYAPGVTIETAEIVSMGETYVTPAGTFNNVLTVRENGVSIKKYAPGVGMIFDDGIVLVSHSGVSDVKEGDNTPADFALAQNYPNPFNPSTQIEYSLGKAGPVTLIVHNLLGQEIATIVDKVQNAGTYTLAFDGSHLNSSVYFYKLESGDFASSRKMILIK